MPRFVALLLGAVVAALIALFLSPVFPPPLDQIIYWLAWIAALVLAVMAVLDLARSRGSGRRRTRL